MYYPFNEGSTRTVLAVQMGCHPVRAICKRAWRPLVPDHNGLIWVFYDLHATGSLKDKWLAEVRLDGEEFSLEQAQTVLSVLCRESLVKRSPIPSGSPRGVGRAGCGDGIRAQFKGAA